MEDLISVIVPIYNVEKYLNRCVDSIINQTHANLEIILVDDGSQDNCFDICEEYSIKDRRIKVIHKINGGLSDARNEGLKIAEGEFIGFVDGDDWIEPEMYERLLESIVKNNSDISACSVKMVWEDSIKYRMLTKQINCVLSKNDAQLALLEETLIKQPVWYKLYKKSIIENIKFPKGKYHEDVFWSFRAIGNANCVSIIDYVGYNYWQRSGSIMGEKYSLKRLDAIEAKCERQKYFENFFPELKTKGLIDLWFTCMYNGQLAIKGLSKQERVKAFEILNNVINKYTIDNSDIKCLKKSHRIWILFEKISLVKTCKIRNLFNIGI